jgi:hypothetical protein
MLSKHLGELVRFLRVGVEQNSGLRLEVVEVGAAGDAGVLCDVVD